MTCTACQLEIFAIELSAEALVHISECNDCRALDREVRLNATALAELRDEPLAPGVWPLAPIPRPWTLTPGRVLPWVAATAAAAAAFGLLLWPTSEENRPRAHAPKPRPFVMARRTAPAPAPALNSDLHASALRLPDLPATSLPGTPALPTPIMSESVLSATVAANPAFPPPPANAETSNSPAPSLRAATKGSGPTMSPVPQVQPLLIKILTDDPNVVIYLVPDPAPSEQAL